MTKPRPFEPDLRFRTNPPASGQRGINVIDSYTGYLWCGRGLHLITPENSTRQGRCKACAEYNERRKKVAA